MYIDIIFPPRSKIYFLIFFILKNFSDTTATQLETKQTWYKL